MVIEKSDVKNAKKFFDPTWRKAKIFAGVYVIFSVIGELTWLYYAPSTYYGFGVQPNFIVSFLDWFTYPFEQIYDIVYSWLFPYTAMPFYPDIVTSAGNVLSRSLNLAWAYFVASFIDSRMKK